MKIEIKVKGKEQMPQALVDDIMRVMDLHGYKNGSMTSYRTCECCECKLPADYPKENNLCPNCEDGKQQAREGHD